MPLIGYVLAAAAGVCFVFQQAVNANLRAEIGSPWWAGFASYLGGTVVMLAAAIALREPLPPLRTALQSPIVSWSGGVFGAIYIAISIFLIPRLGAAVVIALIVAGQMVGSLVFDHFGLLGVPVRGINFLRVTGAVCIIAGVALVRQ
jgi:bacterial/archaeal transporter family-2 protein